MGDPSDGAVSRRVGAVDLCASADALPARPGVVVFEDARGAPVLIASTGDLRAFAAKRLVSIDGAPTTHGDHTHTVVYWPTGSLFEAEVRYLELARARAPETYRALTTAWRGWFVHADPEATPPRWSKSHLLDSFPAEAQWGCTLGPLPTKDSAGRYIDTLIDAYDLCRDERLLSRAPDAIACVYKEMGRCPSPCDGTETMASYRDRTRDAIRCATTSHAARVDEAEGAMREAANAMDFERAGTCKQRLASLGALDAPKFRRVRSLDRFRWLIAAPSDRASWTRLFACHRGCLRWVGDVRGNASEETLCSLLAAAHRAESTTPDAIRADTIGLVSRWLFTPRSKRSARFAHFETLADASSLRALLRAKRAAIEPQDDTSLDLG